MESAALDGGRELSWLANVGFRRSRIHGIGVFAREPIRKGTKVWSVDQQVQIVGPAELGALDADELYFALHGGYIHIPSQKFVYYDDGMQFVNHADGHRANIGITEWTPLEHDNCTALRDIAAGEELLEDYAFWSVMQLQTDHWLVDFYRDFCPEHLAFLAEIERRREAA